jgi:hypothetical protein
MPSSKWPHRPDSSVINCPVIADTQQWSRHPWLQLVHPALVNAHFLLLALRSVESATASLADRAQSESESPSVIPRALFPDMTGLDHLTWSRLREGVEN